MRKVLAPLLLGLGGFFLTTALLVLMWVPGQVKKTPLDTKNTSRAIGDAVYLTGDRTPAKGMTRSVVDGQVSDSNTVVFQTFTCLIRDPDGTAGDCVNAEGTDSKLINASTDAFATDRTTGLAVKDQEHYLGADASPHEGLINKFPFDVQKKTYPFWDSVLGRAVDATFQGEEKVQDLNTYKFMIKVDNEPAEISSGVKGTYSDEKTLWIDPMTGAIINQTEHQSRILPNGDVALDLNLKMDDTTIGNAVKDAKANGGKLGLVGRMPLIAGLLGLLSLALGFILMRSSGTPQAEGSPIEVTSSGPDTTGTAPAAGQWAAPGDPDLTVERTQALPTSAVEASAAEATLPAPEATIPRTVNLDKQPPRTINLEKE
ncbi:MAG: DUF3068 domain-containing protein [Tetrasphaera sp.]|jgi:hypothetical protein|nr:DUF3068 domain-containing protein [Tetrasphaera sp.]